MKHLHLQYEVYKSEDGMWRVHDHYRNLRAYEAETEAACWAFLAGVRYEYVNSH